MNTRRSFFKSLFGGAAAAAVVVPEVASLPAVDTLGGIAIIGEAMETRYLSIMGDDGKMHIFSYQAPVGTWGGVKTQP